MTARSTRRQFLKAALATAGGAAAVGAGLGLRAVLGNDAPTTPHPTLSPVPTPTPSTVETRWPVKRAIFVMLENRSFNHLFGRFPGARNTTLVGVRDGKEVPLIRSPEWLPSDLPHDRSAAVTAVSGGKMDGFAITESAATYAYSVTPRTQI